MFESTQDGVTREQRDLLNFSCQFYTKGDKMIPSESAWWVDQTTGLVNIGGNFILKQGWDKGLLGIKFGKVGGYFNVIGADLEDASELPREVEGNLLIDDNKFRTLEGIGRVGKSISSDSNLLVSLEGMTRDLIGSGVRTLGGMMVTGPGKFVGLAGNPIRSSFLRDDLEEVLDGKTTWLNVYLGIVSGEYDIREDREGTIKWIFDNKVGPKALEEAIRKNPEKMAVEISKVPREYRSILGEALSQINLPSGFKDDADLLTDLGDIGL